MLFSNVMFKMVFGGVGEIEAEDFRIIADLYDHLQEVYEQPYGDDQYYLKVFLHLGGYALILESISKGELEVDAETMTQLRADIRKEFNL